MTREMGTYMNDDLMPHSQIQCPTRVLWDTTMRLGRFASMAPVLG